MKRVIEHYLWEWKGEPGRKSLLLRGARQVGKTFTVRRFGETFESFFEVNFEKEPGLGSVFEPDLDPHRIIRDLALARDTRIIPQETLLFLDEIQQVPRAITALRYFYEEMPELHVVAAGSLLDFAIEEVGIPVGRVQSLHMYPMSFLEFLTAKGQSLAVEALIQHSASEPLNEAVHGKLLREQGEYLAVGGMPEAVQEWVEHEDLRRCNRVHERLANTFRQDFAKYSKEHQIKYVDLVFSETPRMLGQKFVFSRLAGTWRRRDLQPALELLAKASIVHPVLQTAATGVPLGAEANSAQFKVLFLDVGLAESLLGFDGGRWILDHEATFANAGALAEAFVGQELLAYGPVHRRTELYYWHREARSSSAEVDYIVSAGQQVIPIEVKSGTRGGLKSMRLFLTSRSEVSPCGVRFSTHNFSSFEDLRSYPLYGVGSFVAGIDPAARAALESLVL